MNAHTLNCKGGLLFNIKEGVKPTDVAKEDFDLFAPTLAWNTNSIKVVSGLDPALLHLVLHGVVPQPLSKLGFENQDQVASLMEADAMFNYQLSRAAENSAFLHVGAMHGFTEYMLARCGDCARGFTVSWPMVDGKSLGKLSCAKNLTALLNSSGTTSARTKEARRSFASQMGGRVPVAIVSNEHEQSEDFLFWPKEILEFPGLAARITLALECLANGGNLVIAVGELTCACSVELIVLLSQWFHKLKIIKPLAGVLIDTTRLLVCESFKLENYSEDVLSKRAEQSQAECFAPMSDFGAIARSGAPVCEFLQTSSVWTAGLIDAVATSLATTFEQGKSVDAIRAELVKIVNERTRVNWPETIAWFLEPKRFVYYRPSPWALNADLGKHAKKCFTDLVAMGEVQRGDGGDPFLLVVGVPPHMRDEPTILRVRKGIAEILSKNQENEHLFKIASKLAPGYAILLRNSTLIKVVSAPRDPLLYQSEPSTTILNIVEHALQ